MPPPSSGGTTVLQILGILEAFDMKALGASSLFSVHLITEAVKLAFADREAYFGDPCMVDVPMDALLSRDYAMQRRELIRRDRAWPEMPPAIRPRPHP